jgi:hypothetical protein
MIQPGRVRWVAEGDPLAQLVFINRLFGLKLYVPPISPPAGECEPPGFRNDTGKYRL